MWYDLLAFVAAIVYIGIWLGYIWGDATLRLKDTILFWGMILAWVFCGWMLKESWVVIASKFNI